MKVPKNPLASWMPLVAIISVPICARIPRFLLCAISPCRTSSIRLVHAHQPSVYTRLAAIPDQRLGERRDHRPPLAHLRLPEDADVRIPRRSITADPPSPIRPVIVEQPRRHAQ